MHRFNANKAQRSEIASIFGVHPSTVSRWRQSGCPCNDDQKTFSAPAVHKWLIDQAVMDLGADMPMGDCTSPALEEWRQERARIAKIQRLALEGSYITREDVVAQWTSRVIELCSSLEYFVERLAAALPGKDENEVRKIVADEVWKFRDLYSRNGKYCEQNLQEYDKKKHPWGENQ